MKFYFTKNSLPGSKLIRWGLGEDCSHMAVEFDEPKAVIESRLDHGVGSDSTKAFLARNTVVHALTLKEPMPVFEKALYESIRKNTDGKKYDTGAIGFWAVAAIGKKLFGLPQPEKNPWGKRGEHYCVEVLRGSEKILDKYLGTSFAGRDLEMISPYQAYLILRESKRLW